MMKEYVKLLLISILVCSCASQPNVVAKEEKKNFKNKVIIKKSILYSSEKSKTTVFYPSDFSLKRAQLKRFYFKDCRVDCYARRFGQGNAFYIEITPSKKNKSFKVKEIIFNKKSYSVTQKEWGYRSLIPIKTSNKTGRRYITLRYNTNNVEKKLRMGIRVRRGSFPFHKRPLNLGKYSDIDFQYKPEIQEFIKACYKKKKAAFQERGEDLISSKLSHPRNYHYITSPFWTSRVYMRYKFRKGRKIRLKNRIKTHRGLDLRGRDGEPVYAMARGKVVLAEKLFYEGNMIIIYHGNEVFSYVMHLGKLHVRSGKIVEAGEHIADVGSTGVSTAAHLHISLVIKGQQVDPLSLLSLPIRE